MTLEQTSEGAEVAVDLDMFYQNLPAMVPPDGRSSSSSNNSEHAYEEVGKTGSNDKNNNDNDMSSSNSLQEKKIFGSEKGDEEGKEVTKAENVKEKALPPVPVTRLVRSGHFVLDRPSL